MNKKEFEEKFLVINWERMEEINSGFYRDRYFPPPEDSPPVEKFKKALEDFVEDYANNTGSKLDQKYYVCNQDESYAPFVIEIILTDGQWIEQQINQARIDENKNFRKAIIDEAVLIDDEGKDVLPDLDSAYEKGMDDVGRDLLKRVENRIKELKDE